MRSDIYWITVEALRSRQLAISPRPRGGDWLEDEVLGWKAAGVSHVASLLTCEEVEELLLGQESELCRKHGLGFTSSPVPDRGLPASCSSFIRVAAALHERLVEGAAVLVHCRQGIGRASLLAALTLCHAGLDGLTALSAIEVARGRPVPDTEEQRRWLVACAERVD